MTSLNMEEQLWEYIDGHANAQQQLFIEELIATQQEWRAKYQELLDVHQLMRSDLELDEPSMRFTQNVLEQITKLQIGPAAKTYINKKVINGIGIFFGVMILGMLVYGLGQVNWNDGGASSGLLSRYSPDKINFSKFFNNTYTTIFMMINVVMGLMLLDMWLGKKRKELSEKF